MGRLTGKVAIQFTPVGIRCNMAYPGPTPTPLNTPDKLARFDPFAGQCAKHMNMELPEAQTIGL